MFVPSLKAGRKSALGTTLLPSYDRNSRWCSPERSDSHNELWVWWQGMKDYKRWKIISFSTECCQPCTGNPGLIFPPLWNQFVKEKCVNTVQAKVGFSPTVLLPMQWACRWWNHRYLSWQDLCLLLWNWIENVSLMWFAKGTFQSCH